MSEAAYVAVDWGTSSFRLWLVDRAGGMALGKGTGGPARIETQAATGLLLSLALERFTQVLHVVPPRTVGLGHYRYSRPLSGAYGVS